jgi:hypothetical protein
MKALGITIGCSQNPWVFCADGVITRGAMAVFIIRAWSIRMWGSPEAYLTQSPPQQTPHFQDVPANHMFFNQIQKMYELGITTGCQQTPTLIYCPEDPANHRMIAVFSIRARNAAEKKCRSDGFDMACAQTLPSPAYDYPSSPYFADVPPGDVNFAWAQLSMKLGAVTTTFALPGCDVAGYFCMNTGARRGQMATFVTRVVLNDGNF